MKVDLGFSILSHKHEVSKRKNNTIEVWRIILVVMESKIYDEILC